MTASAVVNTMLYCPKCEQTFEDALRRFCPNDNSRLLPVSSPNKSVNQTGGVFTSILNRTAEEADKFASVPRFSQSKFRPPAVSKIFKSEPEADLEIESVMPIAEPESFTASEKISAVQLKPENIKTSLADLVGQTVKDRYYLTKEISENESGVAFLAEDKIGADKKVVVKVLTGEDADSDFANKIYADERLSLGQINHPNIANIIDSGEMADGKPFVVAENVEGESVADFLQKTGQFDTLRTAKIIRQASDALREVHQIGVLHRGLKPENIMLTAVENGEEQVKLTDFGASKDKLSEENLPYKSPEQVEGKLANFTSDSYALAVVAYQMLTNRLPFSASSVGNLLKAQREGVTLHAADMRDDLPASIDEILEKALAFNPFDRYSKAEDFGEAFFNAINPDSTEETAEESTPIYDESNSEISVSDASLLISDATENSSVKSDFDDSLPVDDEFGAETRGVKATEDLAWEKRSPELPQKADSSRNLFSIIAAAVLLIALWGIWSYFLNRPNETQIAQVPNANLNSPAPVTENPSPVSANVNPGTASEEIETPPLPRSITQPPDSIYFQNNKDSFKGDAMRNFLGFSLYYPKDWKMNSIKEEDKDSKTRSKFLDVSKEASSGTPIEQMIVSYYNSKGTLKSDTQTFPSLVKETNDTLKKILPNYQMVSEGEKTMNSGWQAYEVKFQGTGQTENGEKITLWGRRLFIPTQVRGMKNGYVITMLATSLSKQVQSINDVGVKGELSTILETFEPNQNF